MKPQTQSIGIMLFPVPVFEPPRKVSRPGTAGFVYSPLMGTFR